MRGGDVMSRRQELYGWKGFSELAALFAFQGLLGVAFGVALICSEPAWWTPMALLTTAGAAVLIFWLWHLLVPTLVRFELVFMPKVERRVLLPLFSIVVAVAIAAAFSSATLLLPALEVISADVLVLSLVSFAVAWVLWSFLRNERLTLDLMQRHFRRFATGKSAAELRRIELYLQQRAACSTPGIPIRGIEFPGLTSRPWHDPADFPWMQRLEEASPMIRNEITAMLRQPTTTLAQYRYPGVSSSDWRSLMLFCEPNGFVRENCEKMPKTVALLRSLPIAVGREVMVSVLAPHSRIPPHRDSGNISLTCQLGIQIPASGCGIRAGRERRTWTPGQCIVFDTTYEHEVWNDSDEARIVFLFDFLHPDFSETERAFFEQWAKLEQDAPEPQPQSPVLGASASG
jgi:aspartyl/asparaginyl beta-hydroxylase (cupin superfamily)